MSPTILLPLLCCLGSICLGIFCVLFPERAVKRWGRFRIAEVPPHSRTLYLRCYRFFGIVMAVAGGLFLLKVLHVI